MNEEFGINEMLYRAVYPPEIMRMYWKENGEISSAVFKDKNGLSVERAGGRNEKEIIIQMRMFFYGAIIGLMAGDCTACGAVLRYLPSKRSKYHSEIHGSEERIVLSQSQCKHLAKVAKLCANI